MKNAVIFLLILFTLQGCVVYRTVDGNVYVPQTSLKIYPNTGVMVVWEAGFMELVRYDIQQSPYSTWSLVSVKLNSEYRTMYVLKKRITPFK